jgi:hypothetical protein
VMGNVWKGILEEGSLPAWATKGGSYENR